MGLNVVTIINYPFKDGLYIPPINKMVIFGGMVYGIVLTTLQINIQKLVALYITPI
jgi:hypothetical protein